MISFYPGPSAIWDNTAEWMKEACECGILSVNHRSSEFAEMLSTTYANIRHTLQIPDEYEVFFTSSATETWEMILQSMPIKSSAHYFNGAFGQKWFEYGNFLSPKTEAFKFELNEIPTVHFTSSDLICVTHCETSNASRVPDSFFNDLRMHSKGQVIAVDATSSMGGVKLPWENGDIWFASVQKCMGLPAGLCVVVTSPIAAERAFHLRKNKHYNSFTSALENARKLQTTHTPNVLGVYLLGKAMRQMEAIEKIDHQTRQRMKIWYDFLVDMGWSSLVSEKSCQAETVIAISGTKQWIDIVKKNCKSAGFLIGNGYGSWKDSTIRIANFPATKFVDHQRIMEILRTL
jgi:phosphoserine aminotransferase